MVRKINVPKTETFAKVRVIGLGGSGKNVTNYMIKHGVPNVEFIVANTDGQDLKQSKAENKIHLGKTITKGLGTGMNPNLGRSAAEESYNEISDAIKGSDLLFIACGMGGGTGTGSAPVVAKIARELGVLTIGIVTTPFTFEGGKRREIAESGLEELYSQVDSIVTIPNDNILKNINEKTTMVEAFSLSDNVLLKAVSDISKLILNPGDINIDFADLRAIMENSGEALLGTATARGRDRASVVVEKALSSNLIETKIDGARRILFSISSKSRSKVSMEEVSKISEMITKNVHKDAKIIFGTNTDKDLKESDIALTLIATSFDEDGVNEAENVNVEGSNNEEVYDTYSESNSADDELIDTDDNKWNLWKK